MQEPRNGDFVAYIETLQRESAARLARPHGPVLDGGEQGGRAGHFFEQKGEPAKPVAIEQAPKPLTRRDADAKAVKAIVAGVVGAVVLMTALGSGSPFAFALAAILLLFAVPRLLAVFKGRAQPPANRAAVEQVFGRSAPPTKESGP